MASIIDAMQRYEKIMLRCAWAMLHRCLQCSTTRSLDCSPNKDRPISLMPDANSPIISTKHSLLWWLKEEMRLCNSPDSQIQTAQYLFKRCLLLSYNTRPLFCSSTHAPGHFHHH